MFLDYCDGLRNDGFVAELNKKSVDELWKDYKAKYGK
ncbi:unnamed protein product [Linum tenue]|uniref:Uncharacterized protein n=1 Tax=Linum tenue TaxID=586396 RepID=A0AAV0MHY6_9ROSI|nr:unnamed protein product [Linum tenue]CAI0445624.1 unnamed protein product [Linum tenue]